MWASCWISWLFQRGNDTNDMITISYFWMNANVCLQMSSYIESDGDHNRDEDDLDAAVRHHDRGHGNVDDRGADQDDHHWSVRTKQSASAHKSCIFLNCCKNKDDKIHSSMEYVPLTVSSQTSSARSWLSIWVVSMPGLSSFLFSTISEHITYNFCFMWCSRW